MSNDNTRTPGSALLLVTFGVIAVLIGWDLLSDYAEGVEPLHVVVELVMLLMAAAMFAYVLTQVLRGRRQLRMM